VEKSATKPGRVDEIVKFAPGPNVRRRVHDYRPADRRATTSKTVMLTTSNRQWGRIRTQITSRLLAARPLNVDARPTVTQDGRSQRRNSRSNMRKGETRKPKPTRTRFVQVLVNQSLTVLLENGKSLLVTAVRRPVSDRKVTVEVKATIVNNRAGVLGGRGPGRRRSVRPDPHSPDPHSP
jgi:hypothetical protein